MPNLDHEAIRKAYPETVTICDTNGVFDKDQKQITLEQSKIDTARTTLTTEAAAIKYKSDRAAAFASTGDQLDMQYWDAVNGTTTWKDHVAKVKSDNPKP
tara:strand:- start:90 stop:389 length:300 start_codon:yes stop_codon:yes gene_type:complete